VISALLIVICALVGLWAVVGVVRLLLTPRGRN